jgi:hypothetical protein
MSTRFFGQVPPPLRRHGAVVRSVVSGRHDVDCPQCERTVSTWPTAMEAIRAAAYHNSLARRDEGCAGATRLAEEAQGTRTHDAVPFTWPTWMVANIKTTGNPLP